MAVSPQTTQLKRVSAEAVLVRRVWLRTEETDVCAGCDFFVRARAQALERNTGKRLALLFLTWEVQNPQP